MEEPNKFNVKVGYYLLTDDLEILKIYRVNETGVWANNDNRNVFSPYNKSIIGTEQNNVKKFTLIGKDVSKELSDFVNEKILELEKK